MEDRGLPLLLDDLNNLHDVLENSVSKKRALVEAWAQTRLGLSERIHVTNRVLSTIFFGEPGFPVKGKRLVGKYKNGKPKYKTVEERVHPKDPLVSSPSTYFGTDEMHNPNLGWKMDDHVLEHLYTCDGTADAKMAAIIRKMRAEEKVLGTYVKPFIEKQVDGAIHHNINQCSTATGRTSSSNPNSQNMPDEVRKLIGVEDDVHKILQLDFSQLEMCAAAQLSNDPVMIHDVQHKDVHFETGKVVFGWKTPTDMDKHSRRLVKGVNFGTIYGGGPKTLSEQTGADENLVRKLQDAFKTRYPIFSLWQTNLKKEVGRITGSPPVTIDADGQCYYTRMWRSTSGRMYGFQEMRNPYNGKIDVSPSCVVNYPVQGFATGDIIPLFIGYVFGFSTPECLSPINAVHDSIVALVPAKREHEARAWLGTAVSHLPKLIKEVYGIEMSMDLKVDIEVGDTWS
jgi:DNA polymerase I-like protein with 3'-5' exonuclease and polymerase domains